MQTLNTLNLRDNNIGACGAKSLLAALQDNMVSVLFCANVESFYISTFVVVVNRQLQS
jgi:hypothetical protein